MKITIPGIPIAKKRPRFARRGKFVQTYSDQGTDESRALMEIRQQVAEKFEGPVSISFNFFLPRPKGHFGTGRNAGKLKDSAPEYHTKKPDIDNYLKFYMDVLNGEAWEDDAQVVEVFAKKDYAKDAGPKTIIFIHDDNTLHCSK
jgi:Holliday junction resolvase RusA-like endonuclease